MITRYCRTVGTRRTHSSGVDMVSIVISLDLALVRWVHKYESSIITAMMRAITHLGDGYTWTLFALTVAFFERSFTGIGFSLGYAALAGSLTAKGIKHQIRRRRPHRHLTELTPLVKIQTPGLFHRDTHPLHSPCLAHCSCGAHPLLISPCP